MNAVPDTVTADAMTFDQLLQSRHSCRAFLPDAVARTTIERILETAQRAPSWCNAQPWKLVITSGAATEDFRRGLLEHVTTLKPAPDIAFPREYRGVYLERRRACGLQLYNAVGVARGDREASGRQARENFRLFGAPHVAIVTADSALGPYGTIDCGAYVTTFLLAAASHGVGCIAQAALASYSPFVRAHLGIPEDRIIVCGISFGYEDRAHPANQFRTARAPLNDVVDWRS
ncbi:nitroreductase [Paraburkholderia lacunae]|uniref:Nitroreductase n=1 Tax=Paraburkholderia lacunae TaxID=2211104 RepID=A0A370MVE7_9BURK|nr:nitroreductase [Paraburkholderia lacunae]RDJ97360.1 nitroreductase [Paraburkholderia lacunae]